MLFLALCCIPGALRDRNDTDVLQIAVCLFSFGALILAAGIYVKAGALKTVPRPEEPKKEEQTPNRRIRGGCQLCATEAPVIECKIHQLHLCGNCLAQHYDVRSCIYVPTSRPGASKSAKSAARARGA